jgi:hypothetical protein
VSSQPADVDQVLAAVPASLKVLAIDLRSVGVFEWAFPIGIAQEVLDAVERNGLELLGGDTWIRQSDGTMSATGWNWTVSAADSPSEAYESGVRFIRALASRENYYLTFVPQWVETG